MLLGEQAKSVRAGREEGGEGRREPVDLGFQRREKKEDQQAGPAEDAVGSAAGSEEEQVEAAQPEEESERVNIHDLLHEEFNGAELLVGAALAVVAGEFEGGESVSRIPEDVWRDEQEGKQPAEQEPAVEEQLALVG